MGLPAFGRVAFQSTPIHDAMVAAIWLVDSGA
jgi:hypothetical protein